MPKWANAERQAHLVNLFYRSKGFCVYGETPCTNPYQHHYQPFTDDLVKDWIADDRAQALAEWQAERKAIHSLAERGPIRGEFSAIGRDIFHDKQPLFYLAGLGLSVLTFKPFAKVRIASTYINLFVDIGEALHSTSKNKRRKAIRYGKPLPQEARGKIDQMCYMAAKDYLK